MRHGREEFVLQPVRRPQLHVAPLNLLEHVVEGDDQLADFVLRLRRLANGVVAARRDVERRGRQRPDRRRDDALQCRGEDDRGEGAEHERDDGGVCLRAQLARHIREVGADVERSDAASADDDRAS